MIQKTLNTSGLFKLLKERTNSISECLRGVLIAIEPHVDKTLEYIKVQFPNFTDHGMQHSLRIIEYIYNIMDERIKKEISDVEIFCFIMSAFFHDMGMTLHDVDDKDKQRANHHLYSGQVIREFFANYIQILPEKNRLESCITYVCEAHGKKIEDIYCDEIFKKVEMIEGQPLRYGMLTILLRIGDLMDLEETRVSEFNMHLNCSYYDNPESLVHNRRHLDTISYNYSSARISIDVLTDDREKYNVWKRWLDYLDEEVMYANTHYFISENSEFFKNYKLPEVQKSVKPSDDAQFSVEEIRFELDEKGTMWDILTKSIYTNEFDYIRELLQNAIDATLFETYSNEREQLNYISPRSWECNGKVIIAYSQNEGKMWIEDYGRGMNEKELSSYLFKTANSGYTNIKKRDYSFPAIAKFGIGFVACLTKADKIQILTKSVNNNCIRAEIEANSAIAFIDRRVHRKWQGTTIILQVKEKFSFAELEEYLFDYFSYPSVKIELVNVDVVRHYYDNKCLFRVDESILEIIKPINKNRTNEISKLLPDRKMLNKLKEILIDSDNNEKVLEKIRYMLDNNFYDTEVTKQLRQTVRKIGQSDEDINGLVKEVKRHIKENDESIRMFPRFLYEIDNNTKLKMVEYEQLILEFDEYLDVKKIEENKMITSERSGIIYIPTNYVNYNLGVELCSVNAFLFNKGRVVKSIVTISDFVDKESIFNKRVISLDEISDIDFELDILEEDEKNEKYYRTIINREDTEQHINNTLYDILILKNNDFYKIPSIEEDNLDKILGNESYMEKCRLLDMMSIPRKYKNEKIEFEKSQLFQDGILVDFNPQCIVPLGGCNIIINLTAMARVALNVTRHELNNNREEIAHWNKNVGRIIQKQIVENCIRVLRKNNLDFSVDSLVSYEQGNDWTKQSISSIKQILRELI